MSFYVRKDNKIKGCYEMIQLSRTAMNLNILGDLVLWEIGAFEA
jgi:hypothetical protein